MNWHEIVITTTHVASDAVCDMLNEMGAEGVVVKDPFDAKQELAKPNTSNYVDDDFFDELGEDVKVSAYFSEDQDKDELVCSIKEKLWLVSRFLDIGKGVVCYNNVLGEDWETSWKKYYKPIYISDRVVIKPSWEEYAAKENDLVIELDPGMAFGTGQHETTKLCSQFLEKYVREGDKVLDVGMGTGILSIISKKLGADKVFAVDIDDMCVKVAKENFAKNDVEIECMAGVLDDVMDTDFDIVVANIVANVIIDFSRDLSKYLKKGGVFVASGIIVDRKDQVLDALEKNNFTLLECTRDKDWIAMVFRYA
ncbi:MAG: 50S ribosomal protein L11 methyltransferase [Clostridiales bacterium]|nr:50S ribosomal protein L11 methyltransferase [Clostridiales bacterium]